MDNPNTAISPTQHISLLRSFLHAADFKVTKDGKITYPHYQDNTHLFVQDKQDAVALLWDAKDDAAITESAIKLPLKLYDTLDRTQPLESQLSDADKLTLQTFLFHSFFAHKDIDKNDDIEITPRGIQMIQTAQQKRSKAEFKASLETLLIELSGHDTISTPQMPPAWVGNVISFESYLTKTFATFDQNAAFINAIRGSI